LDTTRRNEIRRLILWAVAAIALSLLVEDSWPLLVVTLIVLAFYVRQLLRLSRWVALSQSRNELPETTGAWGRLFDEIYHRLRREEQARQTLEQLMARAENSVTALRDAVVVVDSQGRLEYWNVAAQRLLGFKSPHDTRQTFTNLVRDPRLMNYLERGDFRTPITLPSPLNELIMLEFTVTRFGKGELLVLVRDVTRLHNLEQMRKDFVANVSHELKTPLTVLKGYLETLLGSVPEEQTRLHRALNQMNQQSQRMENLVTDLLMLARLEGTEVDSQPRDIAVAEMLQRQAADGRALAKALEKSIQIEVAVDPSVKLRGNALELESGFGNLITNAVKYTQTGGNVSVRWWQDDQGGHMSVTDNGPGIDPKHIPRLTERFYRPDNSRVTQTGGTGLGLAIVKHVMLRHDGKLEIASTPRKGSTFTCHFPVSRICQSEISHHRHT
jgi:two-component system, OmpR family, phosphate regulon sensor histidine kinase PhoR